MAKAKTRAARPKGDVEQIKLRGSEALALILEYRPVVEPRLPGGLVDGLTTDLAAVGGVVPGALVARVQKKAATGNERATATATADHVGSIRDLVKASFGQDKAVLKAWGVGTTVKPTVTKSVLAAGTVVANRARAFPDEARQAGILEADVAALEAQLGALQAADDAQASSHRASKGATSARDATLVRVQEASKRIALAGRQAFLTQPADRAKFEALLAPLGAKKAAKPAAATASGGNGASATT